MSGRKDGLTEVHASECNDCHSRDITEEYGCMDCKRSREYVEKLVNDREAYRSVLLLLRSKHEKSWDKWDREAVDKLLDKP